MGATRYRVGLDIGSATTSAVILEPSADWEAGQGSARILGMGSVRTEGVRRDAIANIEATTASIRDSLREAELTAGLEVDTVVVGFPAAHIQTQRSTGVVAVRSEEVSRDDVTRVHEVARAVVIPEGRELLHAIPQDYVVDGNGGIQLPVGMAATRLETDLFIVTAASTASRNLRKAVDRAGCRVDDLVLQPLGSNIALLGEAEREAGVALVEVRDAGTDVSVYRDGKIRHLTSIPWGENAVANDIVKGLGVSVGEAAKLKERYGAARTADVDPDEQIEISGPVPGSRRRISRELLAHIIEQRMDEVLGLAYERIDDEELHDQLGAGVVLSGSGTSLPGISTLAQHVFGASVRVGKPGIGLTGMVKPVEDPRYATAVGLALYGAMRGNGRGSGKVSRACGRLTAWCRDFF